MIEKSKNIAFTVLALLIIITFKVFIWDNPINLVRLSQRFDEPSSLFYMIIDRIYKLSDKKNTADDFIELVENDKHKDLNYRYIRILGVIGNKKAVPAIKKAFERYSTNKDYEIVTHCIIPSMGLIGDKELVPFLEEQLKNYQQEDEYISRVVVAGALYLLTGSREYRFEGTVKGALISYLPSERNIEARNVILESHGRKRTYEEMVALDNAFRP